MLEVPIRKEITEYKAKVLAGMSARQLVCSASAITLSIGAYFLCTGVLGMTMDSASYIIIALSLPLMAIGFIRKNGFTFERYALLFIRHHIGRQIRPYQTALLIDSTTGEKKGESKNAWIFKKGQQSGKGSLSRKKRKQDEAQREFTFIESTKKRRKAKRKAAYRKIKAVRKAYRQGQRRAKKTGSEAEAAEDGTRDNQI